MQVPSMASCLDSGLFPFSLRHASFVSDRKWVAFVWNSGRDLRPAIKSLLADDERILQFDAWLQAFGHEKCNLQLQKFSRGNSGPRYGMIAGPGGVQKGQAVVNVPLQAFMSEETALNCPHIGPLIRKAEMTPWQALCLHLLFERAQGLRSRWHPYIALLPTDLEMAEIHPLLWPEDLRKEWLAGSPMLHKTEARVHQCREDREIILAAGANQLVAKAAGSDAFATETSVRWAAAILLSRAFSLEFDEQKSKWWSDSGTSIVLVPWADMLNHSSKAGKESCLKYDFCTKVASLSAHTSYKQGEQVFDSYGPRLSASQLLVDYGFVDQNQNHAIDVQATVLGPIKGSTNEALLNAIGLPIDGTLFSITDLGVDKSILAWTRVAVASLKELKDAGWSSRGQSNSQALNRAASSMAYFHRPVSHDNESEVLGRLLGACEALLAEYPTSLEEDIDLLTVESLPWVRKQALQALISEKLALRGGWKHLQTLLKRLHRCANTSTSYMHQNH